MEVTNRCITKKSPLDDGEPKESDFEVKTSPLALSVSAGSTDVIVKNLYVSIDPYLHNRMKRFSSSHKTINYLAAVAPGDEIDAYGLAKVVASGNPEFEKDDLVVGFISWGEYTVLKEGTMFRKFDPLGFPLSYQVGILGFSGLTAYGGFFEVCKPKKGERVFVSAASGSVTLLKGKLRFDDAFNYKEEPDLKSTLKKYFPDGIDIYFDNVGAEMLEAAVENMNTFGRVAVCGMISEYTDAGKRAAPNMLDVVCKRIKIQGFLAADHMNVYSDFISTTVDHLRTGNLQAVEDISCGLESFPSAFIGLFRGHNTGKKMVKLADE
ncbi:hypothetical protein DVH24_029168 [Malus domestica]|uniref:Enoyl reductase (ER) domain-containing protein n=1 Tax=Malus domestica TaxID=3750 RepID=A0A498HXZ5_MALDO|nr:hypothetical protein DVH24_029168 [Malus domestica]